ncbi:NlpC/P60 family protein [Streptomyces sp. NPDC003077]|uniref:C40 family peptidase n=1 Tax=Streptomyces sp. NPDC003077 TaxID=3154443 RepID=UPI0033A4F12A
MASHRKPRPRLLDSTVRRAAAGLTTAALASVTLFAQAADAAPGSPKAPKPTIEQVKRQVDDLYHQAGTATQKYNAAKERADRQRDAVEALQDEIARLAQKMNDARRDLGVYASAQYRSGAMSPTAQLMLADEPQEFADRKHLMERLTDRQQQAVTDYQEQRAQTTRKRAQAARSLEQLRDTEADLKRNKSAVQDKLRQARQLLARLTAEEKARLAALERKRAAEAKRKAQELARQQAAAERRRQQETRKQSAGTFAGAPSGSYSGRAGQAISFARAQVGKPYVWGATGPSSYDCSGLTQAAWRAAGVSLPRTTWDQVKVGQRVSTSALAPGDLVFFFGDISHVGMYIGGGQMIHAPKPGASVRVESIYTMPIYGSIRPS